jgi:RimJ/RimL family protein N-acetyltransferase
VIWFERSIDYELIRSIITHPKLWPYLSDDNSPAPEDWQPIRHEALWYVVVREIETDAAGELLGLWMFVPQNSICWEIHTALLPSAWGERGQLASRLLAGWLWKNTPCRRVVTNVPASNGLALHFAHQAGMKIYGINEASYLKGGKLLDQICLGLTKPVETPESEALKAADEPTEEVCRQQP